MLKETHVIQSYLRKGQCAVVVTAGGEGSRLGWNGPKGCYPITPIRRHTLFQRLAEKVLYASRFYGQPLPLAIMTSPSNHSATTAYFAQHHFFGLSPDQVDFFSQSTLPYLDDAYAPLYQEDETLLTGPDGNGSLFSALACSQVLEKWSARNIAYVSVIPIDNPLAMPFDAELMVLQHHANADVALLVVPRIDPKESVGVVKRDKERIWVVEYSELSEQERKTTDGDVHMGIFSFTLGLVKRAATLTFPIHYARKRIMLKGREIMAWKQEHFIFDLLPYAIKPTLLRRERLECFAPLKTREGWGNPLEVQEALMRYDRNCLMKYLDRRIPDGPIELSPCFYYPTPSLKQRWKAATCPVDGYYGEHP